MFPRTGVLRQRRELSDARPTLAPHTLQRVLGGGEEWGRRLAERVPACGPTTEGVGSELRVPMTAARVLKRDGIIHSHIADIPVTSQREGV